MLAFCCFLFLFFVDLFWGGGGSFVLLFGFWLFVLQAHMLHFNFMTSSFLKKFLIIFVSGMLYNTCIMHD